VGAPWAAGSRTDRAEIRGACMYDCPDTCAWTVTTENGNRYFVNSSHANQPRLLDAAGEPRLRIHPEDASKRGIKDGDPVRVFNSRGSVALRAELTDDMRPNIVIMLHGW
jgi:anaerobic selenocysteine-containing dehydrogenase